MSRDDGAGRKRPVSTQPPRALGLAEGGTSMSGPLIDERRQADAPQAPLRTMTAEEYAAHRSRLRWAGLLVLAVILATTCGGLAYRSWKPTFEAEAWLQIKNQPPYFVFPSPDDARRFVATQIELMRSPLVLMPVVAGPEVASLAGAENQDEDPVEWLANQLKISSVGQSELFRVSFASHDPKGSAAVVNAVVKAYLELQRANEAEQTEKVIQLLEEESQRRAAEVARLCEGIRDLAEAASIKDPFGSGSNSDAAATGRPGEFQARLADAEFEQALLKGRVASLKESLFRLGPKATTAADGSATVTLAGDGNDFTVTPRVPSAAFAGVSITFESRQSKGNQAIVAFDPAKKRLAIDLDPLATTTDALVKAIAAEGTFRAAPAAESGRDHDGRGLVCSPEAGVSEAAVDASLAKDPYVRSMKEILRAKEARLAELKAKLAAGEEDFLWRKFSADVQHDQEVLNQLMAQLSQRARSEASRRALRDRREELEELQSQLESSTLMVDLLKNRCDAEVENTSRSSGDTVQLEFQRAELARAQQVLDLIESRIVKLRTEQRAPARVSRLQDADTPRTPVEPIPYARIGLASLGGFALPFLLAGVVLLGNRRAQARLREDPVFGPLRFRPPRWWHGTVRLEDADEIRVVISAGRAGPSDADRQAYLDLRRRYAELKPAVAEALSQIDWHCRTNAAGPPAEPDATETVGPQAVWQQFVLLGLNVEPLPYSKTPYFVLEYGRGQQLRPAARVFVWQWQVARATVVAHP